MALPKSIIGKFWSIIVDNEEYTQVATSDTSQFDDVVLWFAKVTLMVRLFRAWSKVVTTATHVILSRPLSDILRILYTVSQMYLE